MTHKKAIRLLWLTIGIFTVIRIIISVSVGLGVDEAHYALYGKFLALSYLDHPPMVGWIEAIFHKLFGMSPFFIRLPAILLFIVDSILIYKLLSQITKSEEIKLIGVIAINTSFLLFTLSFMFLPDSILLALSIAIIFCVKKLSYDNSLINYTTLGILLGLAGLSKYTAILFIPPIIAFLIIKKRIDTILNPKIFITLFISLFFIIPVIYWNWQHDFISFKYQFGHVVKHGVHWLDFLRSLAYQFGAYSPFYFILSMYGLVKSIKSKNDYILLSALLGGFILAFFIYASFTSATLPHWDSIFYLLMIPIGIVYACRDGKFRNFVRISVISTSLLFSFAVSVLLFQYIKFPLNRSPFRDLFGYPEIMKEANIILSLDKNPKKAIAVEHWTFGSRTMYYNLTDGYKSTVYVIQNKLDQFKLWEKRTIEQLKNYDLLFLIFSYEGKQLKKYARCMKYKPVKSIPIKVNNNLLYYVKFEWCYGFEGLK